MSWSVVDSGGASSGSSTGSGNNSITLTGIDAQPGDIIIISGGGDSSSLGDPRVFNTPTQKPGGETNDWEPLTALAGGGTALWPAHYSYMMTATTTWTNQSVQMTWGTGGLVATAAFVVLRGGTDDVRGTIPRAGVGQAPGTGITLSGAQAPQAVGDLVVGMVVWREANGVPPVDSDTTDGTWSIAASASNLSGFTSAVSNYHSIQVKEVTGTSNQTFNPTASASQTNGYGAIALGVLAAPNPPVNVDANPSCVTAAIAWEPPANGAAPTGYDVRLDGGAITDVGNVMTHEFTGLTLDTAYVAEVRAYGTGGDSGWTSVGFTTDGAAPGQPVITATAYSTAVAVAWPAVAGASGYRVTLDGGAPIDIGNTRFYTFGGLASETTYTISVTAYNACGVSSDAVTVTTDTLGTVVACPCGNPVS